MVEAYEAPESSAGRQILLDYTREILLNMVQDIESTNDERVSQDYLGEEDFE